MLLPNRISAKAFRYVQYSGLIILFVSVISIGTYHNYIDCGNMKRIEIFSSGKTFLNSLSGDALCYMRGATHLLDPNTFVEIKMGDMVYPVYPVFLSLCFFLFGVNYWAFIIPSALVAVLTCILLFQITKIIFNEIIGTASIFLFIINLPLLKIYFRPSSDSLYFLFLLLIMLLTVKLILYHKKQIIYYFLISILSVIAYYTRPVIIAFIPFLILFLFIVSEKTKHNFFGISLLVSVLTLGIGFSYSPYSFVETKNASGTIWWGNNPRYNDDKISTPYTFHYGSYNEMLNIPPHLRYRKNIGTWSYASETDYQKYMTEYENLTQAAFAWIKNNPVRYAYLSLRRLVVFWFPFTSMMSPRNKLISTVIYLIIVPVGLFGLYRFRKSSTSWLFICYIFSTTVLHSLTIVGEYGRYFVPIELVLIPFAAFIYMDIYEHLRPSSY